MGNEISCYSGTAALVVDLQDKYNILLSKISALENTQVEQKQKINKLVSDDKKIVENMNEYHVSLENKLNSNFSNIDNKISENQNNILSLQNSYNGTKEKMASMFSSQFSLNAKIKDLENLIINNEGNTNINFSYIYEYVDNKLDIFDDKFDKYDELFAYNNADHDKFKNDIKDLNNKHISLSTSLNGISVRLNHLNSIYTYLMDEYNIIENEMTYLRLQDDRIWDEITYLKSY